MFMLAEYLQAQNLLTTIAQCDRKSKVKFLSPSTFGRRSRAGKDTDVREYSSGDSSESVEERWRMTRRGCWTSKLEA